MDEIYTPRPYDLHDGKVWIQGDDGIVRPDMNQFHARRRASVIKHIKAKFAALKLRVMLWPN